MNIRWIPSPCKECPDRHIKCHASCERYKDYQTRHYAEKDRMEQEQRLNNAIDNLNYGSAMKDRSNQPEPLKHDRKRGK